MNTDKLWNYFKLLTPSQRDEMVQRINSTDLAIKLNPEITIETVEDMFKEYPILKECLEDGSL